MNTKKVTLSPEEFAVLLRALEGELSRSDADVAVDLISILSTTRGYGLLIDIPDTRTGGGTN